MGIVYTIKEISPETIKATSQQGLSPTQGNTWNSNQEWKILRGENIGTDRDIWSGENVNVDTLYDIIKKSPEVVGILKVIVEDMLSDGWEYDGSKTAVTNAQKVEQKTGFFKVLSDALWDLMISGDAYILKLSTDRKALEKKVDTMLDEHTHKFKHLNYPILRKHLFKQIMDSLPKSATKSLQLLKSSTIKGKFDEYGNVRTWVQTVGQTSIEFSPDDVIHLSIWNIGGSAYGFTPLQPLLSDIGTLIFAKDTVGKIFENQGVPPNIWNLPDAHGEDDRDYQLLKKELAELRNKRNKLMDLITTGNIGRLSAQESIIKDIMYKELMVHFTNIILFAWGVPAHRVPFIQARQTVFPKESNDGYFKTIAFMQRIIEPQLNTQLWHEFKVDMMFNRGYRVDEMREANINAIMWDRNAMSVEEGRERLGLPRSIPKGDTMPYQMKQGIFTSYDEKRDQRMQDGDMKDIEETNNTPQAEDNKTK